MISRYCSFFFLLFIFSCSSGGSDYYRDRIEPFLLGLEPNYQPQVYDGVLEPSKFPDLDEDKKTLVGIDFNKDGVRDDLEIFINRNFHSQIERENFKNEIRRAPFFFNNYKTMSVGELVRHSSNRIADKKCIRYGIKVLSLKPSPEFDNYSSLDAIYNTKQRLSAYNYDYQRLAGREYGDGYSDPNIYEKCKAKIDEIANASKAGNE